MASLKLRLGSLVLLSVFCTAVLGNQQLSAKECENLGFTGLALCSDCKTFAEYVKNQGKLIEILGLSSIPVRFASLLPSLAM